ncbi:MAG: MBL fold metallo-hydrolase [Euryarchaeota archaeon]|nr:MBL fold metallo-hydrolase [Euryarchaeota archaeon]
MEIVPLAADSLGTRSMATYLETPECRILIDPGVALGPSRYGLPPHPAEFRRMEAHWEAIKRHAARADLLIITHYHYDHHDPMDQEIFKGKVVLVKHPTERINYSQKGRARFLLEQLGGLPERIEYADGREFRFGKTVIKFSPPVFHGTNDKLGYVVQALVKRGDESFLHTSDVEGPSVDDQIEFILKERPRVVYLDGPLSYMLGFRYSQASLERAVDNIVRVLEERKVECLIVDHHLLRDLKWRERIAPAFEKAEERGIRLVTAAEFLGKEPELLEARRRELYREEPVKVKRARRRED